MIPWARSANDVVTSAPEEEERGFPRLAAGVRVRYHEDQMRASDRLYLKAVADNVSLGGMFLATRHSFPEGTPITLEFHPRDETEAPVRARALVRWRRRWREPRGMGIQFVEFTTLGARRLETWIRTVLAPASADA